MKEGLKEVVREWLYYELPEVIDREINPLKFMSWRVKKIVSIIGFRRTGKTYLLFKIAKEIGKKNCLYVNFEDERIRGIKFKDFLDVVREFYGNKKVLLLLDEIQEVKDWDRWLRTLNDLPQFFVFATGSSSKLGLENIPSRLRGRTITINLLPLSFREFLWFKGEEGEIPSGVLKKYLKDYVENGGMPEIVLEGKSEILAHEYFETFVSRDLVEKYRIKNVEGIRVMLRYLLNSPYVTYSKLYRSLRSMGYEIGKSTVVRYLNLIERGFFVYLLRMFGSVKKQEQNPKKVYIVDNVFIRKYGVNVGLGRLMENTVFLELLRRVKYGFRDTEIFYFKTREGYEVDYLIREKGRVRELVNVTYANSFDEIDRREIRALLHAKELFKVDKPELKIITWDYEDEREISWFGRRGKIKFVPLWKWFKKTNF